MPHDNVTFNFLMDTVIVKGFSVSETWLGRKSSYMSGCSNQWLDGSPVDMKFSVYNDQNCDSCHGKFCCAMKVWSDRDHKQIYFANCDSAARRVCILQSDFISKFEKLISDSKTDQNAVIEQEAVQYMSSTVVYQELEQEASKTVSDVNQSIKTSDVWSNLMFITLFVVVGLLIAWIFRLNQQLKSRVVTENSTDVSFNGRDASIVHPKINNNLNEQSSVCMKISEQ